MRKLFKHIIAGIAAYATFTAVCFAQIKNPVIDTDFPDPTIIHVGEFYYAYATQGKSNIQAARSTDLQHWEMLPDVLPQRPVWADKHFWAPHVVYDAGLKKYILFYSGESTLEKTGKCLGVAFADKPAGPFIDKGTPLLCGDGFINIDPMAIIDPKTKRKLLYWGFDFQPLKVQEMTDDWADFKPGTTAKPIVWPGKEKNYTKLIEGSWIDIQDGKYYLYYSGDNCCGDKANYAVLVARANDAFGPFTTYAQATGTKSSAILEKDGVWLAPGHNSIIKDAAGNKWVAYHAIDRKAPAKGRVMCLKRIDYVNGWPVVK
ncbi:MAG: glycoside hydrolase [Sphingobacteriales bacterium]|nr:MAG: glycoside hydrolase [Sphingobacteriales bacterium]